LILWRNIMRDHRNPSAIIMDAANMTFEIAREFARALCLARGRDFWPPPPAVMRYLMVALPRYAPEQSTTTTIR
jgi:hypothetical protein